METNLECLRKQKASVQEATVRVKGEVREVGWSRFVESYSTG